MPKIAVVGTGLVGSTAAYSVLQRGVAQELVLIDADRRRAEGEAMDLSHALPFFKNARIRVDSLDAARSADVIIVAAS